jgi:hypothetical protein
MADETTIKWKVKLEGSNEVSNSLKEASGSAGEHSLKILEMIEVYKLVKETVMAFIEFQKELTKEFVESDKASTRLNNTLKAMGEFTPEASEAMNKFAEELQNILGVKDELIKGTLSYNIALGMTTDQAQLATAAAATLSKMLGKDLNTATTQLAMTLSGVVPRGLSQTFPQLKNLTEEALRQGAAYDFINTKAKAFLKNTNSVGEMSDQISLAMKNISVAIGKGFLGGSDGMNALKDMIAWLRSIESSGLAENLGKTIRAGVNVVLDILSGFYNGVKLIFTITINAFKEFWADIKSGFFNLLDSLPGTGDKFKNSIEEANQQALAARLNTQEFVANMEKINDPLSSMGKFAEKVVDSLNTSKDLTSEFEKQRKLLDKPLTLEMDTTKKTDISDPDAIPRQTLAAVNMIKGGISSIITSIGAQFGVTGQAFAAIVNFLNQTQEQMKTFVDGLIQAAIDLPQNIAKNVPIIIGELTKKIPDLIAAAVEAQVTMLPTLLLNSLAQAFAQLPTMLGHLLGLPFWQNVATTMYNALSDAFKNFFQSLFFGGSGSSLSQVIEKGGQLFNAANDSGSNTFKVKDYAQNAASANFSDRIEQITTSGSEGLISALIQGMSQVGQAIWNGLQDALNNAMGFFYSIGNQIWQGIKDGLSSIGGIFNGGGGIGGVIGSISHSLGFAEGGLVGGAAPFTGNSSGNDIVPAMLSPGEFVVNRADMASKNLNGVANAMGVSLGQGNGGTTYNISVNVGSNTTITADQLKNSVVPAIVTQLQKLSQSGQPIVSKRGVY